MRYALLALLLAFSLKDCLPKPPTPTPTPVPVNKCADLPNLCVEGAVCVDTPMGPVCEPAPAPTPTPTPTPTPPPAATSCPKALAPGSVVYLNDKRYGNGLDSTVRVAGDPVFCQMIHGVAVNDCHLEGWAKRSECEMELLGGCPVWQYSMNGTDARAQCKQAPHPDASCDHWGDPVTRDDPQTPAFEGNPAACGLQRDAAGDPMAGFFIIGHGEAWFRACKPDFTNCGPWTPGKDAK